MDQFNERLSRLNELSPEELDALEDEMVAAFDEADASGDLDSMQQIADALDQVRAAKAAAGGAEDEAEPMPAEEVAASAETEAVAASVEGDEGDAEPEPTAEQADEPAEDEPVAEPEAEAEAVADEPTAESDEGDEQPDEAEPVADVSNNESEDEVDPTITADEVPEEHQPEPAVSASTYTIRAGGDIPGLTSGAELDDMDAVASAMAKKIDTMRGVRGNGEHIIVASIRTEGEIPEERMLRSGDAFGNARKVRELLADKDALRPDALTAAGWCAPRAPIYDVPTLGTTRRPIKDSLPTFTADRGGIVWMQPPALPDVTDAVSLWRYEDGVGWHSYSDPRGLTETDPADTKPCFTVPCGDEQTLDVDAVPVCLCFDNLTARAFPEWVRGNTDLTMIAQARFAEQKALAEMFAIASTGSCGSVTTQLGVARDFFITVRTAAASLRWRLRLDRDAPLQLLAPAWVRDAMAADLGLQQPGDNTFALGTSVIDGYFGEAGVQPVWYIDDAPGTAAFSSCAFPDNAHWLLYPTGTFVMVDNGELNLGVVRTKEDVQANRYCEFAETFEAVAHMGPAYSNGWLIRGLTAIDLLGSHSLGTDLTP